jgi:hypothetical protein
MNYIIAKKKKLEKEQMDKDEIWSIFTSGSMVSLLFAKLLTDIHITVFF